MVFRKKPQHDDDEKTPAEPTPPQGGEVAPGCSESGTVPPSVVGTSHDPNRKKEN